MAVNTYAGITNIEEGGTLVLAFGTVCANLPPSGNVRWHVLLEGLFAQDFALTARCREYNRQLAISSKTATLIVV